MIRVLLFAELEERLGRRELQLKPENGLNVEGLRERLITDYPELQGIENAMPAVNEEYARADTKVSDGDTVAFIPPVSGG
ncbi:molybdopterin converting factor subunit 1 [Alteribacter natronophilus]|uniref:molybdopterin converting factor subunit 1 n=1 Tax=Alteribacter natronophilus TaxID=2583810 RepID=UPI00110DDFBE|nr:molybdopterin converting factor subunit 1 [Alteribacter natronophilus]TMW71479.1 molybdopterin converting factor subunit 1 [Alteribacter natronophilus]